MNVEEIWKLFQAHMEYTDEEMKVFRSDPLKVKMVTETPEFVKCRVIAEVIESHGCHAKHGRHGHACRDHVEPDIPSQGESIGSPSSLTPMRSESGVTSYSVW